MNQIPAEVDRNRGRLITDIGWLPLTNAQADRIGSRANIVIGMRPEHAQPALVDSPASEPAGLILDVDVIEAMGSDTYVTAAGGLRARMPEEIKANAGDRLLVTCKPEHLHMFDPTDGRRL
ncbi:MAG: hypothetical protein R2849_21140 [Thermomicrobiales bacterium]